MVESVLKATLTSITMIAKNIKKRYNGRSDRMSFKIEINPELCKGCGICKRQCPVNAITGEVKQPHKIDEDVCIKCGTCISKCPFKAISK